MSRKCRGQNKAGASYAQRRAAGLRLIVIAALLSCAFPPAAIVAGEKPSAIAGIDQSIIFSGRSGGPSWFHPRPCLIPAADGSNSVFMTLQTIAGSDYFGPVHWTSSSDAGKTWTKPQPIPGLGRRKLDDGYQEGVCDVVPEYHTGTRTILAIGHNVYYKAGRLARPQKARWPVYVVRRPDGTWTKPQRLEWDDPRGRFIYTSNCSQRIHLPDGRILLPLTFGPNEKAVRSVTSVLCTFDGERMHIKKVGNELKGKVGRGLLEPSLLAFDGRYFMTIRAEDGRGYVAESRNGLDWQPAKAWAWDDGEPLSLSTTQQHWLTNADRMFLIYTRKAKDNVNVFRWRAPLFIAEVNPKTLRLIRASERVVFPLLGDGVKDAKHVALMGNFHPLAFSTEEAWVTVGENRPHDRFAGDALLARIRWKSQRDGGR